MVAWRRYAAASVIGYKDDQLNCLQFYLFSAPIHFTVKDQDSVKLYEEATELLYMKVILLTASKFSFYEEKL